MGTELSDVRLHDLPRSPVRPLPPDPDPERRGTRPTPFRLGLLITGLVLGFLVGFAARATTDPSGSGAAGARQLTPGDQLEALGSIVDGFPDSLLAIATEGNRPLEFVMWPPGGAATVTALPAAWTAITFPDGPFHEFAAIDVSGQQVALATPVAREQSLALMAGRPGAVVAVATGVTSYVWHGTRPRSLAYVVDDRDGPWLEVMTGVPRTVTRLAAVSPGSDVVAWGDWGYVLESATDITLVSPAGDRSRPGRMIAAGATTLAVDSAEAIELVDPVSGEIDELPVVGGVAHGRFNPAESLLALARPERLEVVTAAGDLVLELDWPHVESMAWSSDGRYLLFADRIDVHVLDIDGGAGITALGIGPTVAVGTRPVNSP